MTAQSVAAGLASMDRLHRPWLAVPVGLYLALTILYLFAVPLGESPDEPGHLQCIGQVAQYQRLPLVEPKPQGEWWKPGVILSGRMCYHMPLYYLLGGQVQRLVAAMEDAPLTFAFPPHAGADFGRTGAMFQHADKTQLWQIAEPSSVVALRLIGIGLGLVTLWAAGAVAGLFFPGRPAAVVLAMTVAAGWPQFVYLSRAINNDVLATAWAVVLLFILLDVGQPRRFVWAALVVAAAIVTKLSMLFTVGVTVATWALEMWNAGDRRREYVRTLAVSLLIWGALALVIWWHPTLNANVQRTNYAFGRVSPQALTLAYWGQVIEQTLSSGWARFGWMNVVAPLWQAYLWWGALLLTGAIGLIAAWNAAVDRRSRLRVMIGVLWLAAIAVSYVRVNLAVFQPQFRFALAAVPVVAALSAGGVTALIRSPRTQWILVVVLAGILFAVNVWLAFSLLGPIYGWSLR